MKTDEERREASFPMAKFRLGKIVTTPNALSQLAQDEILLGIQRHQAGGERTVVGVTVLLIHIAPEADRSATTVLLPDDY